MIMMERKRPNKMKQKDKVFEKQIKSGSTVEIMNPNLQTLPL